MKMKKVVGGLLLGASLIGLASCDFNFENFQKMVLGESSEAEESSSASSTDSAASSSSTIYTLSTEDGSTVSSTKEPSTAVGSSSTASSSESSSSAATSSSSTKKKSSSSSVSSSSTASSSTAASSSAASSSAEEEISITSLVDDYTDNYSYLELISDSTYGNAFKEMYIDFYETALEALTSTKDYSTSDVNGTEIILLDKYALADYGSNIEMDQAISAMMTFIYDNPIFYFLRSGYVSGTSTSGGVTSYYIYLTATAEYKTAEARQAVNECILSTIEDFDKNYDSTDSDYDKANYINDYMTDKISYAYEEDGETAQDDYWAHNIEGFFNSSYNQGVCECYARSYLLLSRYVGIESLFVYGYANGNTSYGHAWNYTKIDDTWYGVDVTWNDTSYDSYMLIGSNKLNKDHTAYDSTYGIKYQVELPTLSTRSYGSLF